MTKSDLSTKRILIYIIVKETLNILIIFFLAGEGVLSIIRGFSLFARGLGNFDNITN